MASFMQANGQRIVQMTQRAGAPMSLSVHATNAMAVGAVAAGKQIEELFSRQLYQALNLGLIPPSRLKAANRQIAELSQQAIVDGWRQRLPVRSPPYRRGPDPNKDRLSQLLGPALAREDMLRATTARTISFLNVSTLNREARHWYRVNYGAEGPKVSPPRPRPVPVTVNGNTLFTLQDPNLPMPNSWLPRAFISENDMFFQPLKGPADVHGGGTRAALFTELGFRALAKNFHPVYRAMFDAYTKERGVKTKLRGHRIYVRSRPGTTSAATVAG